MRPLTPEQIDTILRALQNPEGSNTAVLLFTGGSFALGLLFMVWIILNIRLKPVEKLEKKMDKMQDTLSEMNTKMWSAASLDDRIDSKLSKHIREHEQNCPFRPGLTVTNHRG